MEILLHNVDQSQVPLIRELAKALGISYEARTSDENAMQIDASINRIESGTA